MKAIVQFTRCVQDSQEIGSTDEHMVSRVFFHLSVGGQVHKDLYADLKQVVGSDYETGDIEVGRPVGYRGPFNYLKFRDAAERYYRSLVGSKASGIRTAPGANVRMQNNLFVVERVETFEIDGSAPAAW